MIRVQGQYRNQTLELEELRWDPHAPLRLLLSRAEPYPLQVTAVDASVAVTWHV